MSDHDYPAGMDEYEWDVLNHIADTWEVRLRFEEQDHLDHRMTYEEFYEQIENTFYFRSRVLSLVWEVKIVQPYIHPIMMWMVRTEKRFLKFVRDLWD